MRHSPSTIVKNPPLTLTAHNGFADHSFAGHYITAMSQSFQILIIGHDTNDAASALATAGHQITACTSLESLPQSDTPHFDLVILDEVATAALSADSREQLAFFTAHAPLAVLLQSPAGQTTLKLNDLATRSMEILYKGEIASGILPVRVERICLNARLNGWLVSAQSALKRERTMADEISLREHVLRRQQILTGEILSSISAGVLIVDPVGTIMYVNSTAAGFCMRHDLFGADFQEVLPAPLADLTAELIAATRTTPRDTHRRMVLNERHISAQVCELRDQPDLFRGILIFLYDETDEVQLEYKLATAEKLATLATTLSGIAHELRNPLSVIASQAVSARKNCSDTERLDRILESIELQAERCSFIVNSLLDMTRTRATAPGYLVLCDVAAEAIRYLSFKPETRPVTIENSIAPSIRIFADRQRTTQILLNLLSNAIDAAGPKGNVAITAKKSGLTHVVVSVCDSGPGIPQSLASRIFDPFFTTKEPGKGTGLGLPLTARIATESGGTLWFESEPGRTVFHVALPAERDAPPFSSSPATD